MNKAILKVLYASGLGVLARAYRNACEHVPDSLQQSIPVEVNRGPDWSACDFATLSKRELECLPVIVSCVWISSIADNLQRSQRDALNQEAARFLDTLKGLPNQVQEKFLFDSHFFLESVIRHIMLKRLELTA